MISENEAKKRALGLESIILTSSQLLDLFCILSGAYSPLSSFLGEKDYDSVLQNASLVDGTLWTIPCLLDLQEDIVSSLSVGQAIALRDEEGFMVAIFRIGEIWKSDRARELETLFFAEEEYSVELAEAWAERGQYYISGTFEWATLPVYRDHVGLRYTPAELREYFSRLGWQNVALFPGRIPIDNCAASSLASLCRSNAVNLLLTSYEYDISSDSVDSFAAVRTHKAILPYLPQAGALLAKLPLACLQGGGKELIHHAIIAKNFGCSGIIYDPTKGKLPITAAEFQRKLGIHLFLLEQHAFFLDSGEYASDSKDCERTLMPLKWSEILHRLEWGRGIPDWFYQESIKTVLRSAFPPRKKQGVTIFLTGLSGSGKSTIANVLLTKFKELDSRPVTLLDGDIVRLNLSSELGFSRYDRSVSVRRIGFVASEITKNGGIAICAPIAPYREDRDANRDLISGVGGYIEVYVSTPLSVCEERDRKGLYAKARAGVIKAFTGISDPYESPLSPELSLDTSQMTPDEAVQQIFLHLQEEGYLA